MVNGMERMDNGMERMDMIDRPFWTCHLALTRPDQIYLVRALQLHMRVHATHGLNTS